MGFMGLSHWNDSDNAADFLSRLRKDLNRACTKELQNEANEYNTPGEMNILLVAKSFPDVARMLDKHTADRVLNIARVRQSVLEDQGRKDLSAQLRVLIKSFESARKSEEAKELG